jgi:8-oxo-dGTP diphosphatase
MESLSEPLPYKIAVLCYLFDERGRLLLLHRRKQPNIDLYSPIGGKLEMAEGESPTGCAIREIWEEAELRVEAGDLHLTGIVSEAAFNGEAHWLMYLYEVTRPVSVAERTFREGALEWHEKEGIERLPLPETDRQVIWPMFWRYRGKFFMAHIDCTGPRMVWRIEQPAGDAGG